VTKPESVRKRPCSLVLVGKPGFRRKGMLRAVVRLPLIEGLDVLDELVTQRITDQLGVVCDAQLVEYSRAPAGDRLRRNIQVTGDCDKAPA
jgi:hypothetical protein